MRHPDVPAQLRGTYAGLAHGAGHRAPEASRRHGGRADAGARRSSTTGTCVEQGLTQLLGLQHARLLRARHRATPPAAAARGREFKTMVKTLHAAGIEVILDVVYNHTAEGNQLGPTLSLPRHRQRRLLPPDADDPRYYMDYTGCGNTLEHAAPARAAADHGQPALLGHGDARRRLPLRPRLRAGARAARGRPAGRVLRHHPPGPGALAGEADRRAVGPGRRRLPGRQLPGRLDRVERQVPRRRARLLERRRAA